jgi:Tol biopolymer transport system component
VHQVATGSDVDIVAPGPAPIANPAFSPDGNYVYYTSPSPERQIYFVLYQVASLGGTPREIAFDVDSRPSFSPDGKRLVFMRHLPKPPEERLILLDVASRQERILGRIPNPLTFLGSPAWSPDGKHIAVVSFGGGNGLESIIALFDPETGHRQDWLKTTGSLFSSICWVKGGTALATTGQDLSVSIFDQVVLYAYPSGRPSRVTNDFNGYFSVCSSMTDDVLAAVRQTRTGNVYLTDADGGPSRRITSATSPENSIHLSAAADTGTAVCGAARDGVLQIWSLNVDTGASQPLTQGEQPSFRSRAASGVVVFDRIDSTGIHIWRMNDDGSDVRRLTTGAGEQEQGISPDGRYALAGLYESRQTFRVISTNDGRRVQDLHDIFGSTIFSRDSHRILVTRALLVKDRIVPRVEVVPVEGGPALASITLPPNAFSAEWGYDEHAISYLDRSDPNWNVFLQPFSGGARVQLTHVSEGTVRGALWSPDGRRLGYLVRSGPNMELWVCEGDGSRARRVLQLSPETISEFSWMPDSRRLLVDADARSSEAALIRNFR